MAKAPPLAARPTIWTHVPESGKLFTHCHRIFRKIDTACTQSKMGVASYFKFKENRRSMDMDTTGIEAYLGDVTPLTWIQLLYCFMSQIPGCSHGEKIN